MLKLAPEPADSDSIAATSVLPILLVDDDSDVHQATQWQIENYRYNGAAVQLISAYSGAEAIKIMQDTPHIPLIFMDVVMETNNAGLRAVEAIRGFNQLTRIILRTGQPGEAPSDTVVNQYDIDGYELKTDLASQPGRLQSLITIHMRHYQRELELSHQRIAIEQMQQEVIEAQQQAIAELSTPIIPIMDRIIILPLVGSIDSDRARDIMRGLLAGITTHRARVVILDITGVRVVDSQVAGYLNKAIQAARLKGCQTVVTGISDAVAETIVDLGIDWSGVHTVSDLQNGLSTGVHLLNHQRRS